MRQSVDFDSCLVIGEVALAHDGSLGAAHAYIDAIASSGADAVKFQTHIADAESTLEEPWRVKFSKQDATRYDYWRRTEFSESAWNGLKNHAEEKGLYFLSTPFSVDAVDMLRKVGVSAWKLASGELENLPLLDAMLQDDKPIFISSGMSAYSELDAVVERVKLAQRKFVVMQCTSSYPTGPEEVGLNVFDEFQKRYQCLYGLSDHSGDVFSSMAAVTLGAKVLEVHVSLSADSFGPDVKASLTPGKLRRLVQGVRFIETMLNSPVDKDQAVSRFGDIRSVFTRSLSLKKGLAKGHILEESDLILKKPGTGFHWNQRSEIVGKRLKVDVSSKELLRKEHLE